MPLIHIKRKLAFLPDWRPVYYQRSGQNETTWACVAGDAGKKSPGRSRGFSIRP